MTPETNETVHNVSITIAIALALTASIFSMASCVQHNNDRDDQAVTDMVRAGATPIAASCSVGREVHETCLAAVIKGEKP